MVQVVFHCIHLMYNAIHFSKWITQVFPFTKVFQLQCACFSLIAFGLSFIILLLLCPFSLHLLVAHVRSPSLPNGAKEVIIDALCHDCSGDLCANYFDSRVIIIGRVSHNYSFAFHSLDMICLNSVLIVCNFDLLPDVHILTCRMYGEEVMIWGKWVILSLFLPRALRINSHMAAITVKLWMEAPLWLIARQSHETKISAVFLVPVCL